MEKLIDCILQQNDAYTSIMTLNPETRELTFIAAKV